MTENYQYDYEVAVEEPVVEVPKSARVKGLIGMILGILGVVNGIYGNILFPIAGLILSNMAAKAGEKKFSKVGKILSVIGLILSIIGFVVVFILMLVGIIANM